MGDELKSAYELAMERLRSRDRDERAPLGAEQRRRIVELKAEFQARRAEASIMADARKAAAIAAGDDVRLEQVENEYRREVARLAAEEESRLEVLRRGE
ncbi:MAG: hypothetical protein MUF27_00815 [Acidobacteria bacterium]|jgi:hypothetical protein|nr:hypothetical protein [Acidobacteriota bacterium]